MLIEALAPFARPDAAGQWASDQALLVEATYHNTPSSFYQHTPETCRETGRIIASWVRLDNRTELCGRLGIQESEDLTDPQIILAAYRKWGVDCACRLEGDFSFVIHDPATLITYAARDALGTRPFYYTQTNSHFIAASTIAAMKAIKSVSILPDVNWVALFAGGFDLSDTETAYTDVDKLRPGHYLTITSEGHEHPQQYHQFDLDAPHATKRDNAQVERYREAFHRAVDVRARSSFMIGAESSGGLDSASILGRLVHVLPHEVSQLQTYSLVAHGREIELLDELAGKLRLSSNVREVRPETLRIDDSVTRAIRAIGHPPEHGQPLLSAGFFAHAAERGVRTVLSGFGGDEVATGYAKHLIDELHRRREWRAVFGEIEGTPFRRSWRFGRRVIEGPRDPTSMFKSQLAAKLSVSCLSDEFLDESGLRRRLEEWLMPDFGDRSLNTIAALSPGFRYGRTGRLESSALFAASYGVEYRFPFLDRQLIQLFFRTPSIEKRYRSMGRYLHRRAVSGTIPDSITWQPTKDMGPPLDGEFRFAEYSPIGFSDLPAQLRAVMNVENFENAQKIVANPQDNMDHTVMRQRYVLWRVRQVCEWLQGLK